MNIIENGRKIFTSLVNKSKWCFIMNTLNSDAAERPGAVGHWVAVVVDNAYKRNRRCNMYYDSFGDNPSAGVIGDLRKLKKYICEPYELKINRVQNQSVRSVNCGYFAIIFLDDIMNFDLPFKEGTKYNVRKGEARVERQIARIEFGSI